jgi:DNA (cytosine-5)-methyltransferase 1
MGDAERDGLEGSKSGEGGSGSIATEAPNFWSECEWVECRDGKSRPVKSGVRPLAYGVSGIVGKLRGAGNAICPPLAAEFIKAVME